MIQWQVDAYNKTGMDAIKEFADTFFDKPRKFKILEKGRFRFRDGVNTYKVTLIGLPDTLSPIWRITQEKNKSSIIWRPCIMRSNLPPGVSEGMIPGNRPEDFEWDALLDWAYDYFLQNNCSPTYAKRAILVGMAGIKAEHDEIESIITNRLNEAESWREYNENK